jgi:hypothetical protein
VCNNALFAPTSALTHEAAPDEYVGLPIEQRFVVSDTNKSSLAQKQGL